MQKIKHVGIYDRWLFRLGGGEQVAFAFVTVLKKLGYSVELITHRKFDLKNAEKKMNVDLKNIPILYWPDLLDYELSEYTKKYDLFISNSFLDYIEPKSKYSFLSVFFPTEINISLFEFLKRRYIVPFLRWFFVYPKLIEGVKDGKFYGQINNNEVSIVYNKKVEEIKITLFFESFAFSVVDQICFYTKDRSELKPNNRKINLYDNSITYSFTFNKPNNLILINFPESKYSKGIVIKELSIKGIRNVLYRLFKNLTPQLEMRLHGGATIVNDHVLKKYSQILANSKFTQKWIDNYWHLQSEILFPPIHIEEFKVSKIKKNYILNIGRFFLSGHNKKQHELIKEFKKIVDKGFTNWQLHLVGGIAEGDIHRQYVERLINESKGYPIYFHFDIPFSEVKELLAESKIYWHATGLDENEEENPIRMEHFGITTVEAMASGCVPVVYNAGGQKEIIEEGSGYLWNTRLELQKYTLELIENDTLRREMSSRALARSTNFSYELFEKRVAKFIESL